MMLPAPQRQYDAENETQTRHQVERELRTLTPSSGSYTPVITSSGGGETLTYTTQLGQWVREGNLIWFAADIQLATKSGGSADILVSLPAVAASLLKQTVTVEVDGHGAGWTGAPVASITTGATTAVIRELVTGSTAAAWTKLGATGVIRLTGTYLAG
jgi:hypothetical protein